MVYRKHKKRRKTKGLAPCIAARVAPDWSYLSKRNGFRHLRSKEFFPISGLPPTTRDELRYPDLANIKPAKLSKDEKELSRYVQFVFHPRARIDKHLQRIKAWAPIESAYVVPEPELPSMAATPVAPPR